MSYKNLVTGGKRVSASTLIFLERFPAAVTTCHLRRGAIWGLLVKDMKGAAIWAHVLCARPLGAALSPGKGHQLASTSPAPSITWSERV